MTPAPAHATSAVLDVVVHPGARDDTVGPMHGGALKISVREPPDKGKANRAVLELLARALGVPKSNLELLRGEGSRRKSIRVHGLNREALDNLLAGF